MRRTRGNKSVYMGALPNYHAEDCLSPLEYEAPDWYRDAKFGIWAYWSPHRQDEGKREVRVYDYADLGNGGARIALHNRQSA